MRGTNLKVAELYPYVRFILLFRSFLIPVEFLKK
jgi:hypothetical protein